MGEQEELTNDNLPLPLHILLGGEPKEGEDLTLDPKAPDYLRWPAFDRRWEIVERVDEHYKVLRPASAEELEHPLDYVLGLFNAGEDVESFVLEMALRELQELREKVALMEDARHTSVMVDYADLDELVGKANNWDDLGIPPGYVLTSYNLWLKPENADRPKINLCGKVER